MAWPEKWTPSCASRSVRPSATAICSATRSSSRDRFGNRVFHLDARVHLQKIEFAPFGVDEEFDRSKAPIGKRASEGDRRAMEARAQRVVQIGRLRFLDHLLVAPLDRAISVAEMDDGLAVAQKLHFDMAPVGDETLKVDACVAECRFGLRHRHCDRLVGFGGVEHEFHAASAAAADRLHQDWAT